jgi:signal transduction histidine kinase
MWPETWAIPIGLVGLYWSYYIVWLIFPFAVPYPPESLQKFMYAGFVMVLFNGLVWLGIKLNFFGFYDFYKNELEQTFKTLETWQKVAFLLLVYFGLLHYAVAIAGLM